MRPRILAAIVGVALLAVATLAIPLGIRLRDDVRAQSVERLEHAAVAATARIPAGAKPNLTFTLPDLASDGDLAIYDPGGTRRGGEGPARADLATRRALAGHTNSAVAGSLLVVGIPVVRGLRVIAAVRASEPIAVTDAQVRRQRLNIAWFAGAAVLIALVVGLWLSTVLARPMWRLRGAATRLGHGDFTVRAPRSGIAEADAVATALDETAERLEELVERERTFSAHASHQLRTPLTALRLAVEAELGQPRPDPRIALEEVLVETDRLEGTINDLLQLSRGSAERGPVDLQEVVQAANDRWHGLFAAAGRRLHVQTPTGAVQAHASSAALGQILDVLLDNALNHGAGVVEIVVRHGGGGAVIAVGDEGDGVAGDPTAVFSTSASGGHGLGLPLAAALADAEGARLQLARSGPGPRFELTLR